MQYRKYGMSRFFRHNLSAPFIYGMIFPSLFLDISLAIYQSICFPLYGIEKVNRSQFISVFDRAELKYLKPLEKVNCAYCGYVNGLFAYAVEVAASTERYWCGIKHKYDWEKEAFYQKPHHQEFVEYGDEKSFFESYPLYGATQNANTEEKELVEKTI